MGPCCPRCKRSCLAGLSVRWSSRVTPCTCTHCGGLSHVLASTSNGIGVFTALGLVLAVVIAAALQSVLLMAGLALLVACANVLMWRRVELWPITREAAKRSGRASFWVTVLWLLLAFLR